MAGEKQFVLGFGVDLTELMTGLTEAKEQVAEAAASMKESFETVSDAFGAIGEAALAVTAILAGGKAFGEMVQATVKLNTESLALARQFGISATEASQLKVALGETFVTQEQLSAAGARITRTLSTNEEAFKSLGVETRNTDGSLRSTLDVMLDTNEALLKIKEGTDRNVEGTRIYGRGWQDVAPTLRLSREAMEEARFSAAELNLTVSTQSEAATAQYRSAMVGVKDTFEGVFNTIGQALLPILTDLAKWFRDEGPSAIASTRAALATLVSGLVTFVVSVQQDVDHVRYAFHAMAADVENDSRVIGDALHFDFSAAAADWKSGTAEWEKIHKEYQEKIVEDAKTGAAEIAKSEENLFQQQTPTQKPAGGGDAAIEGKSQIEALTQRMQEERALFEEQGREEDTFHEYGKAQEIAYWSNILNTVRLSAEDRKSIMAKIYADIYVLDKQAADAHLADLKNQETADKDNLDKKLADAKIYADAVAATYGELNSKYADAQKDLLTIQNEIDAQLLARRTAAIQENANVAVAGVDREELAAKARVKLNQESEKELIQQEIAFENEKFAIRQQELREELALAAQDPNANPSKIDALNKQLEQLEQAHVTTLQKIQEQGAEASAKVWQDAANSISQAFATNFSKMLTGTTTVTKAMMSLLQDFEKMGISIIEGYVQRWLLGQITTLMGSKATALGQIAANAGVAGSGAVAATSSIPIVGPAEAPAAGAAAESEAMSFASTLSAAGGYDVPAGLNPIMQVHQREMILPAQHADTIRMIGDMMLHGAGSGGAGTLAFHVQAPDTGGVKAMLMAERGTIAKALRRHIGGNR